MKTIKLTLIFGILILMSCDKKEERNLEGIYKGQLTGTDTYNGEDLFGILDAQVSIEECSANCVEVTFITSGNSTSTSGVFNKTNSFYVLDLDPVYEDPDDIKPWEENWPQGSGTYDLNNNELVISLRVDDEHAVGSTDAAYYFVGEQQ